MIRQQPQQARPAGSHAKPGSVSSVHHRPLTDVCRHSLRMIAATSARRGRGRRDPRQTTSRRSLGRAGPPRQRGTPRSRQARRTRREQREDPVRSLERSDAQHPPSSDNRQTTFGSTIELGADRTGSSRRARKKGARRVPPTGVESSRQRVAGAATPDPGNQAVARPRGRGARRFDASVSLRRWPRGSETRLRYSQRVEADVAGLGIEALLPRSGGRLRRPLPRGLGARRARPRRRSGPSCSITSGSRPTKPVPADAVPIQHSLAGTLGQLLRPTPTRSCRSPTTPSAPSTSGWPSPPMRACRPSPRELGEVELAEALFGPMRRDESAHLGYYRTYARQLSPRLAPWQRAVVRSLVVHTYAPVGAGRAADKAPFGHVLWPRSRRTPTHRLHSPPWQSQRRLAR